MTKHETSLNGFECKRVKVSDLVKAPYNPRKISDKSKDALRESIKEFGLVEPIVVNKTTGNVVGGHQRLDALVSLKIDDCDVVFVSLPEEREKALNIALNNISGEWDFKMLADVLLSIDEAAQRLTGFDKEEIDRLLSGFIEEGSTDVYEEWRGMPQSNAVDLDYRSLIIHFRNEEDVVAFCTLIEQEITDKTKFLWFPKQERRDTKSLSYETDEKQ